MTTRPPQTVPLPWSLLCDPRDRQGLVRDGDGLVSGAGARWPIHPGELPDLFVPTQGRGWSRESFDAHYEEVGPYQGPLDYEVSQGGHPSLTRFRQGRVKEVLCASIQPAAHDQVLDVGCGAGWFLARIAERYAEAQRPALFVGVEASRAQAKLAAQRLSDLRYGAGLAVLANAEALPFADRTFHWVTCSETLEQVRDPGRAIAEMARVLVPGGRLLISVPSRLAERSWDQVLAPIRFAKRWRQPRGVVRTFDEYYAPLYPEELARMVEVTGLEIERQCAVGLAPHPHYFRYVPEGWMPSVVAALEHLDRRWAPWCQALCGTLLLWAKKSAAESNTPSGTGP